MTRGKTDRTPWNGNPKVMEECDACGKRMSNQVPDESVPVLTFKRCARCRAAVYCSQECQKTVRAIQFYWVGTQS